MPPKKYSEFRTCSVCGARVKIINLEDHFERAHPKFINELSWQEASKKCAICGREGVDIRLGFCENHLVKGLPRFLIKNVFFPLKEEVSGRFRKERNECTEYLLVQLPMFIYASFGAEPESKPPEAFLSFSSMATFLGYSLVRLCEAVDDANERAYDLALRKSGGGPFRTRYDASFINVLFSEFEYFQGALYGMHGFYDIAVDSMDAPTKLYVVPRTDYETVRKMVTLCISYADSMWRASFATIVRPSGQQCVLDDAGAFFCFPKEEIYKHFEIFQRAWSKSFPSGPIPTAKEFSALYDLLKWVACPFGFTRNNLSKAYNLSDFPNFGLTEDRLLSFLDCLLTNVRSNMDAVSHRSLAVKGSIFGVNSRLMRIAWGFSFSSHRGLAYFLPVREWFYNKIMSVLTKVGRALDMCGRFFEEETETVLCLLSDDNMRLKFSPVSGIVPVLKTQKLPESKTKMDWRIIEKNFQISINDPLLSKTIGGKGEIDLIVSANFSLYLLELKSLNLTVGRARKHISKEAPRQCAKYATWARQEGELQALLRKHGIPEEKVKSVRVICCTNGVFDDTEIACSETGELFPLVPQYMLFSLFAGSVTVSVRDVFPKEVLGLRDGLLTALPDIQTIGILDLRRQVSKTANTILSRWLNLMIFDRRRHYSEMDFKEAKPFSLAKFLVFREVHVGGNWRWLLEQPVFIECCDGWKYYLGTQVGSAGITLICPSCQSAVKYYISENEEINDAVKQHLENRICPFCGEAILGSSELPGIAGEMTKIMARYKYQLDSSMLDMPHTDS